MALFIKTAPAHISLPTDVSEELQRISEATGINKSQLHTLLLLEGLGKFGGMKATQSGLYRNAAADKIKIRNLLKTTIK